MANCGSTEQAHEIQPVPNPLSASDIHHIRAAQGWLELGDDEGAIKELDGIAPECRCHPDVLGIRWHILAHGKKWEACVDIADTIAKMAPQCGEGWIHRSFALHTLKRTQEAFDKLLPAAKRFPRMWTIPYNLSCYCAQLGLLDECQKWFKKAMAIDAHTVRLSAIEDSDLKPFWDRMTATSESSRSI